MLLTDKKLILVENRVAGEFLFLIFYTTAFHCCGDHVSSRRLVLTGCLNIGGLFIERSVTINHMPMYVHLRVCSFQELAGGMKTLAPLQFEVLGSARMLPGLARLLMCIEYLKFYSLSLGGGRQSEVGEDVMGSCAI